MIDGLPFTIYDLVGLGIILVMGLIIGFWGIMGLITGLGAWIGAGLITLTLYPHFQNFAQIWMSPGLFSDLSAAAGGFAMTLAVLMLIGTFISRRIQASILGPVNRALGFATGGAIGYMLVSLAMVITLLVGGEEPLPEDLKQSRSYPLYVNSGVIILGLVPETLKSNAMRELETRREKAEDAYDAYRLYREYISPKPRNEENMNNSSQEKDAKSSTSTYNNGVSTQDRDNLEALIRELP